MGSPARILVVDDSSVVREMLRRHLAARGHVVIAAADGLEGLARARADHPDLILLDVDMPRLDGLGVLDARATDPSLTAIPVIVLTSHTAPHDVVRALDLGAQDHVGKDFQWPVLDARVDAVLRAKRLQDELRAANARLATLAATDGLTGVANRRRGEEVLDGALSRARRAARADVCLVRVDIDHFKAVNDRHGHAVGDEVLRRTAADMSAEMREGDVLARWGGDEFVAIVHDAGEDDAARVADRLRSAIAEDVELQAIVPVSVSVGWALWDGQESADSLLHRADVAMYAAKDGGRDAVRGAV